MTQSYDKSPYTKRTFKNPIRNTKKPLKLRLDNDIEPT